MVILRFAPSPTGALHLGGLRTALYNYLYARKLGGKWILRIEDTDQTRVVPGSVDGIRRALSWMGMEYDYGPGKPGPHGPYYQSERLDLYQTYARKLLDSGHAYRCFCSADILLATRERLARSGAAHTYDKTCLHLTDEEVVRRVKAGEKHVIRLNDSNLAPRSVTTKDLIFGTLKEGRNSVATDPILLKTDLFPTYHLASVADDHEMGVTHVVRGEEWITSLPIHLDLYAALSITPPQFAHLPLLLNPDGTKMSKRNGDIHVLEYMEKGWEPESIMNWLALAGWGKHHEDQQSDSPVAMPYKMPSSQLAYPDSTSFFSREELIANFDLSVLTHRRNVLDHRKLDYLNKQHLLTKLASPEELRGLAVRMHEPLKEAFPTSEYTNVDYIMRVIVTLHTRLVNIQEIAAQGPYFFVKPDLTTPEAEKMIKSTKLSGQERDKILTNVKTRLTVMSTTSWKEVELVEVLHDEQVKSGSSVKAFMTLLRWTLTGMKNGPGLSSIAETLGRERTLARLDV